MGRNKERFNRRGFLKLSAAMAAGAALSGCSEEKEPTSGEDLSQEATVDSSPSVTPTVEQKTSPPSTDLPSPTPEATATIESLRIPGDNLTEERLAMVFAGLGGGEIESGDEKTISYQQLKRRAESCWNMAEGELDEKQWSDTLRLIGVLGLYKGDSAVVEQAENEETAVFNPGRHKDEIIYPQADLNFLRTKLTSVEDLNEPREELNQIWPEKAPFLSDTDMTVYGVIAAPEPDYDIDEAGPYRRALVSLTDYRDRRRDEEGRPRHYFAALPVFSEKQKKQMGEMVFLNKILEQQGLEFDEETLEVSFINSVGERVVYQLNRFPSDETLLEEVSRECGWRFVDKVEEPIIPPAPKGLLPNEGRGRRGRLEGKEYIVSMLSDEGEWVDRAKAVYNREEPQWEWVVVEESK